MTQEDQDRIIGQTRREHREAKQQLAALRSKVRKLGERMVQIGNALETDPENLLFHGEPHDPRFQTRSHLLMNANEFADVQNLLGITNQIRDGVPRVEKLRKELIRLEGEDPETEAI
jgi:site-specific recombinase XerC